MNKYYKPTEQVNEYSIIKILGEGRYGIVYLAENNQSEKYIIKQLKKEMLETTKDKLFYEQTILNTLNDFRFPKFIETFENEDAQGYILQYMEGRVFEDLLFRDNYKFTKEEIYRIATQLIAIIDSLESNNIVHRDIRPPNVLITKSKELLLIDFGLARYIDDKKYIKQLDYWYLGDFLLHLYYTTYSPKDTVEEKPWYEELDLNESEKSFLKKLLGIDKKYKNTIQLKYDLNLLKSML